MNVRALDRTEQIDRVQDDADAVLVSSAMPDRKRDHRRCGTEKSRGARGFL